jgi:hypothetical protein
MGIGKIEGVAAAEAWVDAPSGAITGGVGRAGVSAEFAFKQFEIKIKKVSEIKQEFLTNMGAFSLIIGSMN